MVKKLQEKGLVTREPYKKIFLTKQGTEKAKAILRRHEAIKEILIKSGTPEILQNWMPAKWNISTH